MQQTCCELQVTKADALCWLIKADTRGTASQSGNSLVIASIRMQKGSTPHSPGKQLFNISLYRLVPLMSTTKPTTCSMWKLSQPACRAYSQMNIVRHASIVALAAPDKDLVTTVRTAGHSWSAVPKHQHAWNLTSAYESSP